jgi:ppGpp synthetase/RelA/SpoT-type nucleotidyltranferase
MNIDEYDRLYFTRYQAFADVVRNLLDKAIIATGDLPRPQSIQARAKTPASLRKRLAEVGNLDADVAAVRRDLAGVRLIFYTNNDVDRFLSSSIVFDNFEVDRKATKIHHPVEENGETRYQAIHYTVLLNEARATLPEYMDFAGLRCEIQIQTILVHAWAETSHDIIYKVDEREGFGNDALAQIKKRFERIMDKYLVPAGYEFQRVQKDYQRLVAGKLLFDRNLLLSLQAAEDNNARYDLLLSLADDLLPLYDDVPSIFPEVVEALVNTVESARSSPVKAIETPFATYAGRKAEEIIAKTIEIIDQYRYAAIEEAFLGLQRIFLYEMDEKIKERIVNAIGHLCRYDLEAWEQVGPGVQYRLAAIIKRQQNLPAGARPLIIETWKHFLDADVTGAVWSAEAVSLRSGEVSIAAVHELRQLAIAALFELFKNAIDDSERREIFGALSNATRTSSRCGPTTDFLGQTLVDHASIVRFFSEQTQAISYELRETIEHSALYAYHRAIDILGAKGAAMGCQQQATDLAEAILGMRDRFNEDRTFARYKILVGFEGVMPQQWGDLKFNHEKIELYRDEQIDKFVEEVNDQTQSSWLGFLERCAATKSDDMATFPKLGQFLSKLSERKPFIAKFLLSKCNDDLVRFLAAFLNGLFQCLDKTIYKETLSKFLSKPDHLSSIALHWRGSAPDNPESLKQLLQRSIEEDDRYAVAECALFIVRNAPEKVPSHEDLFRPALSHLITVKDARWADMAWLQEKTPFFENLEADDAGLILKNLVELPELSYSAEQILSFVAEEHLELVWDFLAQRLEHPKEEIDGSRYEAVPYRFQLLGSPLSSNAILAVAKVSSWFEKDASLFQYRGGRVLAAVFPLCPNEFSAALIDLIGTGSSELALFVLGVMQNFYGEPSTHPVLKALLLRFPDDAEVRRGVSSSLANTGVVHGEFGFVESLRKKKAFIEAWLDDGNDCVSTFARQQIGEIDREILAEKRQADARSALRKLEYENLDGLSEANTGGS